MVCIEDTKATNAPIQVDLGNYLFQCFRVPVNFCSSIYKSGHWNKMRLTGAKKGETTDANGWGSLSCLLLYKALFCETFTFKMRFLTKKLETFLTNIIKRPWVFVIDEKCFDVLKNIEEYLLNKCPWNCNS